jgi:hypothetical protein
MPIIPVLEGLKQEAHEYEAILYLARPVSNQNKRKTNNKTPRNTHQNG